MKELIERIVGQIVADKEERQVWPAQASLVEIMRHPDMQEAVKDCMRGLAIGGPYRAGIDVRKTPLLIKKEKNDKIL